MPFDKAYMKKLLFELVAIPSVSKHAAEENACADLLCRRLSEIAEKTGADLRVGEPAVGDALGRRAVLALLRSPKKTARTVLLTGHFDVVDPAPFGTLADRAFDPEPCTAALLKEKIPEQAREDLASGGWLAGRGIMDMKAGLALFVTAIKAWAEEGGAPLNIVFLAVPDEEADSDGMRGALPAFADMLEKEGLECIAALTGEPCFWNESRKPSVRGFYTGSTGKIMPLFLALGRSAHIADYFSGVSAALMIAEAAARAEAAPELFERGEGWKLEPAACLSLKVHRESYSVTLPDTASAYFNVLTVRTPAEILEVCLGIAKRSAEAVRGKLEAAARASGAEEGACRIPDIKVLTAARVIAAAKAKIGAAALEEKLGALARKLAGKDARERSIATLIACAREAAIKGPAYVVGFVPPYYPARLNRQRTENERRLRAVMEETVPEAGALAGDGRVELTEMFTGISDLSFLGFDGSRADLEALSDNMAGWGDVYDLPIDALLKLDVPVANMGPSGRDAHKGTERLEMKYSFDAAPELLMRTVKRLAER
jgi:arginine utilization protein RocB